MGIKDGFVGLLLPLRINGVCAMHAARAVRKENGIYGWVEKARSLQMNSYNQSKRVQIHDLSCMQDIEMPRA